MESVYLVNSKYSVNISYYYDYFYRIFLILGFKRDKTGKQITSSHLKYWTLVVIRAPELLQKYFKNSHEGANHLPFFFPCEVDASKSRGPLCQWKVKGRGHYISGGKKKVSGFFQIKQICEQTLPEGNTFINGDKDL